MVDPDRQPSTAVGLFLRIRKHAFDSRNALIHFYLLHDRLHYDVSAVKAGKHLHLEDADGLASR